MRPPKIRRAVNNGKPAWLLDLRSHGGGRMFFQSKTDAETARDEKAVGLRKHGRAAFELSTRQMAQFLDADARLTAAGASLNEAVEFFLSHKSAIKPKKLGEAVRRCLEVKEKNGLRPRYIQQLGYSLKAFLVGREMMDCHSVMRDDILAWLDNPEWGNTTRKNNQTNVSAFFSFAEAEKWVTTNPCSNLPKITLTQARPGILSVAQAKSIMETALAIEPKSVPYFALALFCGIRPQEIMRLTWDDVDIERGFVKIDGEVSKTRQRRLVKISDNCKAWLQLGGDVPPVNWQGRFVKIIEALGMSKTWPKDGMRHSFCSYALPVRGGIQTSSDAGNSETILFKHYREIVTPEDAAKFWEIYPGTESAQKN